MTQKSRLQMNQDLFANIPPEIIIAILSKLPVLTIISCKRVCKSWLNLLESRQFVESHLLKSIPGLAVFRSESELYELFEFDDGLDLERHELHYKPLTKFNIPACNGRILGSTNGLLFLCRIITLHICNPITREYIKLEGFVNSFNDALAYGFGSSKITGQHKVVKIFHGYVIPQESVPNPECVCHVYTIGTGLWRRISPVPPLEYHCDSAGAFLNGNLHWLVSDFEGRPQRLISCFDLETERFSTFSSPVLNCLSDPTILDGCLCLCDNSVDDGICIWLMKEYGVEESWSKLFSISDARSLEARNSYIHDAPYAIKIFRDGDVLLEKAREFLFYSKKDNTVQKLEKFGPLNDINALIYTPSFLSLKSFGKEKVISF